MEFMLPVVWGSSILRRIYRPQDVSEYLMLGVLFTTLYSAK
jgi:hypothetical protein